MASAKRRRLIEPTLDAFPDPMLDAVVAFLNARDLCLASVVSHRFRRLCDSDRYSHPMMPPALTRSERIRRAWARLLDPAFMETLAGLDTDRQRPARELVQRVLQPGRFFTRLAWVPLHTTCPGANTGPPPVKFHTATYLPHLNAILHFGGFLGPALTDDAIVLHLDSHTWERVPTVGAVPCARAGHVSVAIGTRVYVMGGLTDVDEPSDSVHVLETSSVPMRWSSRTAKGDRPKVRVNRFLHRAHVAGHEIVVAGTWDGAFVARDWIQVRALDTRTMSWRFCAGFGASDLYNASVVINGNLHVIDSKHLTQVDIWGKSTPHQVITSETWPYDESEEIHAVAVGNKAICWQAWMPRVFDVEARRWLPVTIDNRHDTPNLGRGLAFCSAGASLIVTGIQSNTRGATMTAWALAPVTF
ncbi:F-box domain-containing protein [Plasmodiophora brassicae]